MEKFYNDLYLFVASNLIEVIIFLGLTLFVFMLFLIIIVISRGSKLKKFKKELELTNYFISEERAYDIVNAVIDHKNRENLKETAHMIKENIEELEETMRLPELEDVEDLKNIPSSFNFESKIINQEKNKKTDGSETAKELIEVKKRLVAKIVGYKNEIEQLYKIEDPELKKEKKEELSKKMIIVKAQLDEYKDIEEELIKKI